MTTSPITEINQDNVLDLLRAVVAEAGEDYVYPESQKVPSRFGGALTCVYLDLDTLEPLCIVGKVFAKTTADLSFFRQSSKNTINVYGLGDIPGVTLTPEARTVLGEAQRVQDTGCSWGRALEVAVTEANRLEERDR